MRFFLDSASADEARRIKDLGLLDGIWISPALAREAGVDYRKAIRDLAGITDGPVLAELEADDTKGMYKESRELAKLGKERRVGARVRSFVAAPLVIARSDLLLTGPSMLIRYFAEVVPLQVLAPPVELPTYPEEAYWHERFDADPAHTWFRKLLKKTAASYGLQERPRKRSW